MTKAILVTGASTGIGRGLTEQLATQGHIVYATARKDLDLSELSEIENVVPIKLDVRNQEQINDARELIEARGTGLYGLVNNAGVGVLGHLHTFTDDEIHDIFDVNVHGPHRMTNALLDLLLESKGRVVNIGSQGGQISMAFYGPYTMTKHALEAFTTALDQEIAPFGMHAAIVQPGGIKTPIFDKMNEPTIDMLRRAKPPFDEIANQVIEALENPNPFDPDQPESASNRNPSSPEIVTEAVLHALFAERPHKRYLVGTRWEGNRVIDGTIEKLVDANRCKTLKYSRDELVAKLDEALKQSE